MRIMVKHNLRKHEAYGLILTFAGATWIGLGVYGTLLAANRLLANVPLISGTELLLFPLFYGLGALMLAFGKIELKEALPGKGRR
jgi:hypothetical protein